MACGIAATMKPVRTSLPVADPVDGFNDPSAGPYDAIHPTFTNIGPPDPSGTVQRRSAGGLNDLFRRPIMDAAGLHRTGQRRL